MSRTTTGKRGFTLMEALIVMAVISTLLYAILGIFGGIGRQWNAQASRSKAIESANLGIDKIAQEISDANSFNLIDGVLTNTFTLPKDIDASGEYIPVWSGSTLIYNAGSRVQFYLAAADGVSAGNILWRRYFDTSGGTGNKAKKKGKPKHGGAVAYGGWVSDLDWSLNSGSVTHGQVENVTSLIFLQPVGIANVVTIQLTVAWPEGPTTATYTVQRDVYMVNHN